MANGIVIIGGPPWLHTHTHTHRIVYWKWQQRQSMTSKGLGSDRSCEALASRTSADDAVLENLCLEILWLAFFRFHRRHTANYEFMESLLKKQKHLLTQLYASEHQSGCCSRAMALNNSQKTFGRLLRCHSEAELTLNLITSSFYPILSTFPGCFSKIQPSQPRTTWKHNASDLGYCQRRGNYKNKALRYGFANHSRHFNLTIRIRH